MTMIGAFLMILGGLMFWSVKPRGGGVERGIMQVPGTWVAIPLLIMLCLLGGWTLIFTYAGK